MPFSLRLDPATRARIHRLTVLTAWSQADVVRAAVSHYAELREAESVSTDSAFDRLRAFIGAVGSGGARHSTDTHAKYRAALQRKRRARRSR
jgi:hypothetical protein